MKKPTVYVLDSDVFIAAKNAYYAFDICPGFWESIVEAHQQTGSAASTASRPSYSQGSRRKTSSCG